MMRFILGLIVGIIFVPGAVVLYLISGRAPTAASDAPLPFEKLIAKTALNAKIHKEMPTAAPIQADEPTFMAGARIYRDDCAMCHGLLKQPAPIVAKAMFPNAPQLLPPHKGVTDDSPGESFWKAKFGIRLSGMPGFKASLSDQQMWEVSLLLANADKLPNSVQKVLEAPTTAITPSK